MSSFKDKPLKKCHTDKRKMIDDLHFDMIEEMENTRVVIYSGQTDDWGFLSKEKLLPIADNYINLNFPTSKKILSWEIKYK